jgi:hypothetical protein
MKLRASYQHVLGEISPALLDAFHAAVGDGSAWPTDERGKAYPAQRYTRTLAFRENEAAALVGYAEANNADLSQSIVDLPPRTRYREVEPILEAIVRTGIGASFGKVLAVWLRPLSMVAVHQESGSYFEHYNRVHVPVVTDEDVITVSGPEKFHMQRGKIYLLQNLEPHGVISRSRMPRLHLIADVV